MTRSWVTRKTPHSIAARAVEGSRNMVHNFIDVDQVNSSEPCQLILRPGVRARSSIDADEECGPTIQQDALKHSIFTSAPVPAVQSAHPRW